MSRFALVLEYNGSDYCGWQRQKLQPSVQEAIENAICKLEPDFSHVNAAGRTDTGVHAMGQVIHFDMNKDWSSQTLLKAINSQLRPAKIAVLKSTKVDSDFHARFSAIKRTYLYKVIIRSSPLVFKRGLAWQIYKDLDMDAMTQGASFLVGHHDFTSFRSTHCQALSPVKTLDKLQIQDELLSSGKQYNFTLEAPSFLHKQVRSMVGTLVSVGLGNLAPRNIKQILVAKDRSKCGPLAPPHGLYLKEVCYNPDPFAK